MYDFLPTDVRDLAITAQAQMWIHRLDSARPKKKPNAHPSSDYIFSGKLIAKQDGQPLNGTLSGDGIEYYRHPKSRKGRRKNSIFNRQIAAKPLHEAAARALDDALLDRSDLRARLTKHAIEQRHTAQQDSPGVAELEAELQAAGREMCSSNSAM